MIPSFCKNVASFSSGFAIFNNKPDVLEEFFGRHFKELVYKNLCFAAQTANLQIPLKTKNIFTYLPLGLSALESILPENYGKKYLQKPIKYLNILYKTAFLTTTVYILMMHGPDSIQFFSLAGMAITALPYLNKNAADLVKKLASVNFFLNAFLLEGLLAKIVISILCLVYECSLISKESFFQISNTARTQNTQEYIKKFLKNYETQNISPKTDYEHFFKTIPEEQELGFKSLTFKCLLDRRTAIFNQTLRLTNSMGTIVKPEEFCFTNPSLAPKGRISIYHSLYEYLFLKNYDPAHCVFEKIRDDAEFREKYKQWWIQWINTNTHALDEARNSILEDRPKVFNYFLFQEDGQRAYYCFVELFLIDIGVLERPELN